MKGTQDSDLKWPLTLSQDVILERNYRKVALRCFY